MRFDILLTSSTCISQAHLMTETYIQRVTIHSSSFLTNDTDILCPWFPYKTKKKFKQYSDIF